MDENIKLIEKEGFTPVNKYSVSRINHGSRTENNESNRNDVQNVAINWFGGWHHAQRDAAEGFCYVNDIVIAIQFLLKSFNRVLYIDLDVHHGNGVENAFVFSPRVLVLSLHKYETGFYPSTGSVDDIGLGNGKYHTVNVPLKDGITDAVYIRIFTTIFDKVFAKYKPECIVVQCGADSVAGDPLGGFNLTPLGLGHCLRLILNKNLPTLVLGGGGYNVPNVARCWTYLTSVILDCPLPNDIPDNSYFHLFGPDFELSLSPTLRKNENSEEYVQKIIDTLTTNLDCLPAV
ncbi:UNVERIFIED_CONTAM: hypothetical protein PYX00_001882 [Menopon gallinae]|uniref:Histone deacetylase 8 n=1 Tax=Menopon gallinae TaxID=328185 RepID=A0AAW2IFG9_9NEOP